MDKRHGASPRPVAGVDHRLRGGRLASLLLLKEVQLTFLLLHLRAGVELVPSGSPLPVLAIDVLGLRPLSARTGTGGQRESRRPSAKGGER